jgi:hypothetical protein
MKSGFGWYASTLETEQTIKMELRFLVMVVPPFHLA